jgi:hypothetical protein
MKCVKNFLPQNRKFFYAQNLDWNVLLLQHKKNVE